MNRRLSLLVLLLCLSLLSACSRRSPTSPGSPLGMVEISFEVQGNHVRSSATWLDGGLQGQSLSTIPGSLQFDYLTHGSFEVGVPGAGERYLYATYAVRNADVNSTPYAVARQNVTLVAARTADTLANTAVRRFRLFDGSDAPVALVQSVTPTHGMMPDPATSAVIVDEARADLQVFSPADLATLVPNEGNILNLFPYGFVVRNPAGGRTLAANPAAGQFDGRVTIAVKLPLQENATNNPFTLSMLFLVTEDSITQVTQSLEEQDNAGVLARAAAVGASRINLMVGTRLAADANQRLVCGVLLAGSPAAPERYLDARDACRVFELVNEARAVDRFCNGTLFPAVAPLRWDGRLWLAAQRHSFDMATNDFFSHTGSDGSTSASRIVKAGYPYVYAAENIAAGQGTPEMIMAAWLGSPAHCSNIMSSDAQDIGVAKVSNPAATYPHYWTQIFGRQ